MWKHGKKGEVSEARNFAAVLFSAGESEQKKVVYIKDTKSFSGFKNVVLTFGSVILF